ncbi:MAG TPA: 2-oxoglutarate dehydrogenase complex dihydrolipoyllysine-residue succinyltransferase [Burkholderiaceae bacterium]|nr:2-oxoglutarate dehydrogenase complex dihydrolipoyllysine-residue succinyltransferase [Burkholderiaceae bacterium]
MSTVEVKVPQLSESVSEATLLHWKKPPGAPVSADEILVEIETDKVVLEVPAPSGGSLAEILVNDGANVVAGQVIARIDAAASGVASAPATPAAPKTAPPAVPGGDTRPGAQPAGAILMPAAARMLSESGQSGAGIVGTGRDGRITKADVIAAQAGAAPAVPAPPRVPAPAVPAALADVKAPVELEALANRPEQRVAMSRLRQRVAERLVQSQATAAILTTFNEVNMQPVIDLRNRHKERFEKEHGVKLGFMSFFVKAAVAALKRYPIVNASVDGADIVYHGYFDIGVAVGSPRGLVVPIVRDADALGFAQIEKKIADFGKRAGEGKLSIEELTGGTFTISNGGVFGSMLSTPIINPPQSAILGVHATRDRPVVENGQIVVRPMNYLALSYDHRIIDGREAVLALVAIKEALEDPARLLLEI